MKVFHVPKRWYKTNVFSQYHLKEFVNASQQKKFDKRFEQNTQFQGSILTPSRLPPTSKWSAALMINIGLARNMNVYEIGHDTSSIRYNNFVNGLESEHLLNCIESAYEAFEFQQFFDKKGTQSKYAFGDFAVDLLALSGINKKNGFKIVPPLKYVMH